MIKEHFKKFDIWNKIQEHNTIEHKKVIDNSV